ncbi:MAG: DUF2924 domain-containing protein [Afipia sp.]|nr:DUF2924 domain-containing protein [Afipia sp.]
MAKPAGLALGSEAVAAEVARIQRLTKDELRALWLATFKTVAPKVLSKDLTGRVLAYRIQEQTLGGLDRSTQKLLDRLARGQKPDTIPQRRLKSGTVLVREYQGERHTVTVANDGFIWKESTYPSLSVIARAITGTAWNGPRFFGLRSTTTDANDDSNKCPAVTSASPPRAIRNSDALTGSDARVPS